MIGMAHVVFQYLISNLSSEMVFQVNLTKHYYLLVKNITVVRMRNTHIKFISDLQNI